MNRRYFIGHTFFGAAFLMYLANCAKSDSTENTPVTDPTQSCETGAGVTYSNPGHTHTTVAFTAQEIGDGVAGDYTLMDTPHTHSFTFTADDFTMLKTGTTITKADNESHGHMINVVCATS